MPAMVSSTSFARPFPSRNESLHQRITTEESMAALRPTGILGIGGSLPDKRLTNHELERIVETSDEWILQRTGIRERRILEVGTPLADLGEEAARKALAGAGVPAADLDLIIVATITPDSLTPSMACVIQARLGADKAAAFDVNAACTGFLYAMDIAQKYISTGSANRVLVVALEGLSRVTDWQDRKTCVLFGDGAGAAVLGPVESGYGICSSRIGAAGSQGHVLTLPAFHLSQADKALRPDGKAQTIWMDGSEVFAFAARTMADAVRDVSEQAGFSVEDLDWIFPHQANMRILQNAQKRLKFPMDRIYTNLEYTGNISSASIPVCLDEAVDKGLLKRGDKLALVAFGGGLTWGATTLVWSMGGN
jgi:3-oxoacyl-[acyl-carrier-protein] synthase III